MKPTPKPIRERASWVAWVGFSEGRPFVQHISDTYCDQRPDGTFPESHEYQVFTNQKDADIRYRDARRARITLEPVEIRSVPRKARKRARRKA